MIGSVTETAARLQDIDNAVILTHRRPDGDTVGSASALCAALRVLGKEAYVAYNPEITARFEGLIRPFYPAEGWTPETVIAVDCADRGMIFPAAGELAQRVDIAIDHHRTREDYAQISLVNSKRAACAEIICEVIEEMGVVLNEEIARGIYVGVSTDTGCFKFSNTTAHTHLVAAKCLETGLNGGEICRELFEVKSKSRFAIEKIIISTMRFYRDGTVAVALITRKDKEETGADWDDLDSIAGLPRTIEGVEVALTFTELDNGSTKLSARTTEEADAAAICEQLGGGGHVRAAGATIELPAEQAIARTLEAVERMYHGEKASV